MKTELSSLKVECASKRWAREEFDVTVEYLGEDFENEPESVFSSPMIKFCKRWRVSKRMADRLKRLKSDFWLDNAKVSSKMKKALKDCNVGSHCSIAKSTAILSNRLADMRTFEGHGVSPSGSISGARKNTGGPANSSKVGKGSQLRKFMFRLVIVL